MYVLLMLMQESCYRTDSIIWENKNIILNLDGCFLAESTRFLNLKESYYIKYKLFDL